MPEGAAPQEDWVCVEAARVRGGVRKPCAEADIPSLSLKLGNVEVAETGTRQVRNGATAATMHDLVAKAHRKASR
ncbi:MAG TPA: hypothetical protein VF165_21720 [Nocardioidaceae bacterium]